MSIYGRTLGHGSSRSGWAPSEKAGAVFVCRSRRGAARSGSRVVIWLRRGKSDRFTAVPNKDACLPHTPCQFHECNPTKLWINHIETKLNEGRGYQPQTKCRWKARISLCCGRFYLTDSFSNNFLLLLFYFPMRKKWHSLKIKLWILFSKCKPKEAYKFSHQLERNEIKLRFWKRVEFFWQQPLYVLSLYVLYGRQVERVERNGYLQFLYANKKKTGPEAGQYFHVRPPIGFIWMGYKTQEE